MSSFDNREKGHETKFVRDEELQFKTTARRNKLAGLWAAEKLGLVAEEAEAYAKAVVVADFEKPGDGDVIDKLHADLNAGGIEITRDAVHAELNRLLPIARDQIRNG